MLVSIKDCHLIKGLSYFLPAKDAFDFRQLNSLRLSSEH